MRSDCQKCKWFMGSALSAVGEVLLHGVTTASKSVDWLLTTNGTHVEKVTFIMLGKNPTSIVHKLAEIWISHSGKTRLCTDHFKTREPAFPH